MLPVDYLACRKLSIASLLYSCVCSFSLSDLPPPFNSLLAVSSPRDILISDREDADTSTVQGGKRRESRGSKKRGSVISEKSKDDSKSREEKEKEKSREEKGDGQGGMTESVSDALNDQLSALSRRLGMLESEVFAKASERASKGV